VPYFEFSFSRKHLGRLLGETRVREGWPAGSIPAMKTPPEWSAEVARRLGIGFICTGCIWELGRVYAPGAGVNPVYAGGSVRSRADLGAAPRPAVEPFLERLESFLGLGRQHELAVGWVVYGPLAIAQLAMGLEEFCIALYDDTELIRELIDAATEFYVPLVERAVAAGIDFLLVSEALCSKNGPLVRPELTRQLWRPGIEKYLAPATRRGVPVGLHSDGDNRLFLEDFIALGFSFLHPLEPCDGAFDIVQTKARVGDRLALAGGIDLAGVLSSGTPDQVATTVADHLRRLGPLGGYLCGSSHEIDDSVPPGNLDALVEAIHRHAEP
jgi:uroporphyrinogen-III decarboxylase